MTRGQGGAPAETLRDRTILALSVLSAVLILPVGLHLPYFPVYLSARGLGPAEIGAVLATPLVLRIVVTPIVAGIADRRGIAATLAVVTLAVLCGYGALFVADGFVPIFLAGVLAATALGLLPSLADALTLSQIRRPELADLRPISYSRIKVWTPVGVLGVMLASGPIVAHFPGATLIVPLLLTASIPALAALLAATTMPGEQAPPHHARKPFETEAHRRLATIVVVSAALVQSSHAQIYSFGTLHWRAMSYSADFVGVLWAMGVGAETMVFLVTARFPGFERRAMLFLVVGATGAVLRWLAMSFDPPPEALLALQALHGASFAATYLGSVLVLGGLAGPGHRARMQGRLAAASAFGLALATFLSGRLVEALGEATYLVMAGLAASGLCLVLFGGVLRRGFAPRAAHSAAGRRIDPG